MRQLPELRADLDRIDRAVIELLAERLEVCREVAHAKEKVKARVIQPGRVREVWNSRRSWAAELGVDPDFVEQMFRTLLAETHRIETAEAEGRPAIPTPPPIAFDSGLGLVATRVDHLAVAVRPTEVDEALAFLIDALGFTERARATTLVGGTEVPTIALEAGTVVVVLVGLDGARVSEPVCVVGIEVLDTTLVQDDLVARGCEVTPIVAGVNGVEQAFVARHVAVPLRFSIVSRTGVREGVDGSLLGPGFSDEI